MMMMMVWGYCYFSIEVWTVMLVLRQRRYSLNPKQLQIKITYRSSDAHQRIISNTNHVLPNHCHQRHSSTTVPCNNGVASALLFWTHFRPWCPIPYVVHPFFTHRRACNHRQVVVEEDNVDEEECDWPWLLNIIGEIINGVLGGPHKSKYGYCIRVWYRSNSYNSFVPVNRFEHTIYGTTCSWERFRTLPSMASSTHEWCPEPIYRVRSNQRIQKALNRYCCQWPTTSVLHLDTRYCGPYSITM